MKWYHRTLSGLLAASMGVSLLGGMPRAAAVDRAGISAARSSVPTDEINAVGEITATLRLDYPISVEKLTDSKIAVKLLRKNTQIASGTLTATGSALTFTDGKNASGTLTLREGETGDAAYVDVSVKGLSAESNENTYYLEFSGTGFKPYKSPALTLDTNSRALILGTGDATFTQGDVNGDNAVNEADIEAIKKALGTTQGVYDLNGDAKVDISDLAAVTMASNAQGDAQVLKTALIAANLIEPDAVADEIRKENGGMETEGKVSDMLNGTGNGMTFKPSENQTQFSIPIPIAAQEDNAPELEQIEIVSSAAQPVETGMLIVETADGKRLPIPFDASAPDGALPLQARDEARKTVKISLGKRVPVKKVTIHVACEGGKPVVVEQIKFLQDVVPNEPVAQQIKNIRVTEGAKQVALAWDEFPNVTGYKVYYGESAERMTNTVETRQNSCTITGLDNLKPYYFAVAPVSDAAGNRWEGAKSNVVTAVPQPAGKPDKPDNITVTSGDTMLSVTWKPGKDTQYSCVQYRKKGTDVFTKLGTFIRPEAVIMGLENGETYEIQVFGVNKNGDGPASPSVEGTPKAIEIEGPALPEGNRIENSEIVKATYPEGNIDKTLSKGTMPEAVYDNDYRTSWIARTWNGSRGFTFTFANPYTMDYLIYVPDQGREPSGQKRRYRDFFKHIAVSVNGQPVETTMESGPDKSYFVVKFPKQENVTTITVEGSQWDGAGSISLSEIAFYEYDSDLTLLENSFNSLHDALKPETDKELLKAACDALEGKLNSESNYFADSERIRDEIALARALMEEEQPQLTILSGFTSRSTTKDDKIGQSASALQPLGLSALSGNMISVYVDGLGEGETANLVQWQQYSETGATRKSYALHNGRNRISLSTIGNAGLGERGGSLYLEYGGTNADKFRMQVRDTSESKTVVTKIPMLNISSEQWYDGNESSRKELIQAYVTELQNYVAGLNNQQKTNTRNATEIATPSVLLSIPASQVLAGLGNGDKTQTLYDAICAWEQMMFLMNKTQGIVPVNTAFESYRYPMQTRQNIRFSRMFSGAFMFAAGSYIGIEWSEIPGMVTGKPLAEGDSESNHLFGWGIAHEIGHNMDKIGYAEITNNIYSLVAQAATADGRMTGQTRLEKDGIYPQIFDKVALGKPGQAGNVFVQLGMFWQLHLAYDGSGNTEDDKLPLYFFNEFFTRWKANEHDDAPSTDDRIALIAADVTGKNLTNFFTRWGMELDKSTKEALGSKVEEPREIWYLNDESRRLRLGGVKQSGISGITVSAKPEGEKTIALTINTSGDTSMIQGYEILRNGVVIDFLPQEENTKPYIDEIGAANNMVMHYQVRAIDKLGNEVGTAESNEVRISYDTTISANRYEIASLEDGIVITAKDNQTLSVSGIKITSNAPSSGSFTVRVSKTIQEITEVPAEEEGIPMTLFTPALPIEEQPPVEEEPTEEPPVEEETPDLPPDDGADDEQTEQPEGSQPGDESGDQVTDDNGQTGEGEDGESAPDTGVEEPESKPEQGTDSDAAQDEESTEQTPEIDQPIDTEIIDEAVPLAEMPELLDTTWVTAKNGDFSDNLGTDGSFLTYFNKPGTTAEDTRIWMYDAKQIVITGIPESVALEDIQLLDYPGDNIAFMDGNGASIGILADDYTYEIGDHRFETIEAGTIVVIGSYRGSPYDNKVRIQGKTQNMVPGSADKPTETTTTLSGEALLLAEVPEDGEVSTISDGIFLFVPSNQEMFKRVNEDHKPQSEILTEIKAQMWRSDSDGGDRMTSDTQFISVPRYDSMPNIVLESGDDGQVSARLVDR